MSARIAAMAPTAWYRISHSEGTTTSPRAALKPCLLDVLNRTYDVILAASFLDL